MKAKAILCAALLVASIPAALAQTNAAGGNVNDFTPAQRSRAEAAVRRAGYTPVAVSYVQDNHFFIIARKGNANFMVTVTPQGQVTPSTENPPPAPAAAP